MEEEIDIMDIMKYFWRKKVWILIIGIVCVILAVIYNKFLLTPMYNATSKFILTNNEFKTEADVYSYAKLPDRYYAVVNSKTVLDKVIKNLKLDIKDVLSFKENNVKVTHTPVNFLISVSVNTEDAKKSALIANEIVKVSMEEIKNIYQDENISVLDYAVENWTPINVNFMRDIVKFVLVGEVFTCGFILIMYIFVEPIKDKKSKIKKDKNLI